MIPKKTLNLRITGSRGAEANGSRVFPLQGFDYSISETTTSGGGKLLKIVFENNFEAFYNTIANFEDYLDPTVHIVHFDMENDGTYGHAAILKRILDKAGVSTLASSFTAAEAALVESTAFSIPNADEDDYSSYRKYAQDLLASTLGYVFINDDYETEYELLAAPVAGDEKTEDLALDEGVSASLEYQDVVSSLIPDNPHIPFFDERDVTQVTSRVAQVLHEVTNAQNFRHVMATVSNERIDEILAVRSNRQVRYSYKTATEDADTVLGQDVTIVSPRVLGGSGSQNVKVIGIGKSAEGVNITSSDLLGLE
jgi:hypothetical protein